MRSVLALGRGLLGPKLMTGEWASMKARVWPQDMNLGMHMDNVRYLSVMDTARNQYMLRTGLLKTLLTKRLAMPIASSQVRYKRSLLLGQAFEVRTRLCAADDRWLVFEQQCIHQGQVMTVAYFKCAVLKAGKRQSPRAELLHAAELVHSLDDLEPELLAALAN